MKITKRQLRRIIREVYTKVILKEDVQRLVKKVASGSRSENEALRIGKEDELYSKFDDNQKQKFEVALEEYYEEMMMGY